MFPLLDLLIVVLVAIALSGLRCRPNSRRRLRATAQRFEMKDVELPQAMQQVMATQAEAIREKRARPAGDVAGSVSVRVWRQSDAFSIDVARES
jgi:hypothetical protein